MPSIFHDAILHLFETCPNLVPELLRTTLRVPIPAYSEVRIESADVTQLKPVQRHADLVLTLRGPSKDAKPVMAVVVEVQLTRDPRRHYVWLESVAYVRSRLECPVYLLVFARSASMARWCATPLVIDPMGSVLKPIVLRSALVPEITTVRKARESPELAILSAMAHGTWKVAYPVIQSLHHLDEERRTLYLDLIETHLKTPARSAFEDLMYLSNYKYQGSFARRQFSEGEAKGKAEGEAKGKAEGIAEGEARGKAEGEANAILTVLEARGVGLTKAGRSRILTCTDLSQLERWVRRVALVASEREFFDEVESPRPPRRVSRLP